MPEKMNYFSPKDTAQRYAKGRPFHHRNIMKRIRDFLAIEDKLDNALDVACGTGLSTVALTDIAKNVIGADPSAEMLKQTARAPGIQYVHASAEDLPFADDYFDIITVASAVHWFDIDQFLKEAHRILKSGSWLVLYENHFGSEMLEVESFKNWFPEVYLKKYPSPRRNDRYEWTSPHLKDKGFQFEKEETFINPIEFSKEQLILYFTTQSNIASVIESGQSNYEEVESWLDGQLSPFYSGANTRTLYFGNWIKYLQKSR